MDDEMRRGDRVAAIVLPIVFILGVLTPTSLLVWYGVAANVATRQADVGKFVGAGATPGGLFAPTLSTVRTTVASVAVVGSFSTRRGIPLVVEYMNKTGLRLCVAGTRDHCVPLDGEWVGDLQATPAAAQTFDFYGWGLTSRGLVGWLVIGIFLLFCGTIVWALNGKTGHG